MLDALKQHTKIKQTLKKTKGYDDPYYIVMGLREGLSVIEERVGQVKADHKEDIYKWQYVAVGDKLAFISIACTKQTMRSVYDALIADIDAQGYGAKIALVHHNSLAEPLDTLAKAAESFEALEYPPGAGVNVALQDFADTQGVWEGMLNGAFSRA
ncbi:MAG: hypothetical protein ACPG4U_03775 [Pseudomonadales bacterium]